MENVFQIQCIRIGFRSAINHSYNLAYTKYLTSYICNNCCQKRPDKYYIYIYLKIHVKDILVPPEMEAHEVLGE